MGAINSGGGRCAFFRVSADHATIYSGTSGTTEATAASGAALVLGGTTGDGIVVQTDYSITETGELNIKINQTTLDDTSDAAVKVLVPRTSSSATVTTQTLIDETGRSIGGSASGGVHVLCLSYGGVISGGTKRMVYGAIGTLKKTSGGHSQKAGDWVAPGFEFVSVPCLAASGLTIAADLFVADLIDVATITDPVLGYKYYYDRFFLTEAA